MAYQPGNPGYTTDSGYLVNPFMGPPSSHFSFTLCVKSSRLLDRSEVMVENGSRKLIDMVAGILDVFCFLSKNFAIWGFP